MMTLKKLYLKLRDGIPGTVWLVLIVALLAVMLSLNGQQAKQLPLSHIAGVYQSDTAVGADIYYNAQLYIDGRYEVFRIEKNGGDTTTTTVSEGTYQAMEYGYLMEETVTGRWQAITLDHVGFYWTDQDLNRLTHFRQFSVYGK